MKSFFRVGFQGWIEDDFFSFITTRYRYLFCSRQLEDCLKKITVYKSINLEPGYRLGDLTLLGKIPLVLCTIMRGDGDNKNN